MGRSTDGLDAVRRWRSRGMRPWSSQGVRPPRPRAPPMRGRVAGSSTARSVPPAWYARGAHDRRRQTHRGLLVSGRFPELEDALCERIAELKRHAAARPGHDRRGLGRRAHAGGDLLVRRLGAFANVGIVTLARLAVDLVEAQASPPAGARGVARERLVRRLLDRHTRRARLLPAGVVDQPHFAGALAATFADLREGRVAPDTRGAEAAGSGGRVRAGHRPEQRTPTSPCSTPATAGAWTRSGCSTAPACTGGGRARRRGRTRGARSSSTASTTSTRRRSARRRAATRRRRRVPAGASRRPRRASAWRCATSRLAEGLRERRPDVPAVRTTGRIAAVWSQAVR